MKNNQKNPYAGKFPKDKKFWESERGLLLLRGFARSDLSDDEISAAMGVTTKTFLTWYKASQKIRSALSAGNIDILMVAEEMLIKLMQGYSYEIEKVTEFRDEYGAYAGEKRESKPVHVEPNFRAITFVLNNLAPEKWQRNKLPVIMDESTLEQLVQSWGALGTITKEEKQHLSLKSGFEDVEDDEFE